ncbi:MAG: FtsQ-type POTRA domain-containing protein [Desulfovermiculus sp.]|nr:FtsQ-type POTRA domain-containing protein [Desulfovermiculus sp.]
MAKYNAYRHKRGSRWAAPLILLAKVLAALVWAFCVLALLVLVSLGLVAGYRWTTTTQVFVVQEVQVQGIQRLSRQEVVAQAGLERFHNLLDLSLWKIRRDLQKHPWIASVSLFRRFPHGLRIEVEEEIPFFWRQQGERIYYADEHGEVIAPVEVDSFTSLPLLDCDPNQLRDQRDLAIVRQGMEQQRFPFGLAAVAWIRFEDNNRVEIALTDHDVRVVLGREHLQANMQSLTFIWHEVQGQDELEGIVRIMVLEGTGWVGYRSELV